MTKLIIVGGFLGAGKTTLLMESAKLLAEKGYEVGLITNDQAEGLVDSVYLSQSGSRVLEVSGSCFCCNFDGFVGAVEQAVFDGGCDVIIAEPVGSCTDLTATIIRPLLANHPNLIDLAPLTVLADPVRLFDSLEGRTGGLHESAAYIYGKQLEDAGTILVGKSDLLYEEAIGTLLEKTNSAYPEAVVKAVSSKNRKGLDEWLMDMMQASYLGSKTVEMDYEVYAEGEAVLGWLNAEIALTGTHGVDWQIWFVDMVSNLSSAIDDKGFAVGHVKAILQHDDGSILANITGTKETLQFRGQIDPGKTAILTINARVQTEPQILEELVFEALERSLTWHVEKKMISLNTLSPGRPNPTHRITES